MTTTTKPPETIVPQKTSLKHRWTLHWDSDDPATPALIWPLIQDSHGVDDSYQNNPQFLKAVEVAAEYGVVLITHYQSEELGALTMKELGGKLDPFIEGYMAAITGKVALY